jgi:hypothetical protein
MGMIFGQKAASIRKFSRRGNESLICVKKPRKIGTRYLVPCIFGHALAKLKRPKMHEFGKLCADVRIIADMVDEQFSLTSKMHSIM